MITTWYLQSQRTWDRLCHSCRGSSFLPRGAFPEGGASVVLRRRHAGSLEALWVHGQRPWFHEVMTDFTMYSDNFCWPVRTLEHRVEDGRVRSRSPAMAAGLADHVWTMREWITMPSVQCA